MPDDDPTLSAEVLLTPRDGRDPSGPITAATLAEHQPEPAAATKVREYFRGAGFAVGPVAGISFSITGPRSRFEQLFGEELTLERTDGGDVWRVTRRDGGVELPLGRLPRSVAPLVYAVTFTPPPDFGPGGYA